MQHISSLWLFCWAQWKPWLLINGDPEKGRAAAGVAAAAGDAGGAGDGGGVVGGVGGVGGGEGGSGGGSSSGSVCVCVVGSSLVSYDSRF